MNVLSLNFTSPLHLSDAREDYTRSHEYLNSDKLWAILLQTWSALGLEQVVKQYHEGNLNLHFSSAYPFTAGEKDTIFFMPRAGKQIDPACFEKTEIKNAQKEIKKVEWYDLEYFHEQQTITQGIDLKKEHLAGKYLSKNPFNDKNFVRKEIQTKVRVPRSDRDATPYYVEKMLFSKGSGLYLVAFGSEANLKLLQDTLAYIGKEDGIGTYRNLGWGRFEVNTTLSNENKKRFEAIFNYKDEQAKYLLNLGTFHPGVNDIGYSTFAELTQTNGSIDKHISYQLLPRSGWITQEPFLQKQKNSTYFLLEGGVWKKPKDVKPIPDFPSAFLIGDSKVNLTPKSVPNAPPVLRNGQSIFIPIHL